MLSSPEMSSGDTCEMLSTSDSHYRLSAQDFSKGGGGGADHVGTLCLAQSKTPTSGRKAGV